ncbi:MAG: diguanylate cyclase [bacterium]|nr:diguanylate cyclase [bacterium]
MQESRRRSLVWGAGGVSLVAGGGVLLVAWIVATIGLPSAYSSVISVLAELLCVIVIALAWRFRRNRVAMAALTVALANGVIRFLLDTGSQSALALTLGMLAIALPVNCTVAALSRDHRVISRHSAVLGGIIVVEAAIGAGLFMSASGLEGIPAMWLRVIEAPQAGLLALLIAEVLIALAFFLRRAALEGALLWCTVACSLAVMIVEPGEGSALLLASGQIILLIGLGEDSYRLAFHDELTGLPARRAFNEALRMLNGEYAIAMVDVDRFKRFNDRHGHEAGDQALRMVADELATVTGGGRSYRYGGEEFAVLFPGKKPGEARQHLEELRAAIAERQFAVRAPGRPAARPNRPRQPKKPPRKTKLTVSIGLAGPNKRRPAPEDVLRAADRALYRAKEAGRNRLSVS